MSEQARRVVGALAQDLRGDWHDTRDRVSYMKDLNRDYQLDLDDAIDGWDGEDGRYFRAWRGPYGNCTREDLKKVDLDVYIFSYPEYVVDDY